MPNNLRLLFIGNSHTYYNDMPLYIKSMAADVDYNCAVTMIAHGGWTLEQHASEPEAKFNILYGEYDYVILQEHSHPFVSDEKYRNSVIKLNDWIKHSGAKTVIFSTWSKKDEPEKQPEMNRIHEVVSAEIDAVLAAVGENWWAYKNSWPSIELYADDGAHASKSGSEFAAKIILEAILSDMRAINIKTFSFL